MSFPGPNYNSPPPTGNFALLNSVTRTWNTTNSDFAPSNPSLQDDEFDGSYLDGKWIWTNYAQLTSWAMNSTAYPSQFEMVMSNPGGRLLTGIMQALPVGDFTFIIKGNQTSVANNTIILCLADGVTVGAGNQFCWMWSVANNSVYLYAWTNYNTLGCTPAYGAPGTAINYLRISRAGSTYYYYYSADGKIWTLYYSSASYPAFTPTHFGIQTNNYGGSANTTVDYFRYYNTANPNLGSYQIVPSIQ